MQARLAHHVAKDRGIRLIAADRPGIGKSTLIRDRKLDDWPKLMARFADHLGIGKFGQLGVSGGQGVMTDAEIYLSKPEIRPEEITHPIRYWHGGDDKNIPTALVEDLTAKMPNATLDIVDGLGHFSLAVLRAGAAMDFIAQRST